MCLLSIWTFVLHILSILIIVLQFITKQIRLLSYKNFKKGPTAVYSENSYVYDYTLHLRQTYVYVYGIESIARYRIGVSSLNLTYDKMRVELP